MRKYEMSRLTYSQARQTRYRLLQFRNNQCFPCLFIFIVGTDCMCFDKLVSNVIAIIYEFIHVREREIEGEIFHSYFTDLH